jgi:AcrR family transcriptional regulator
MALESTQETGRSDAKRRAIIDVARDVFLSGGYAAASMSEIAARVGGSKGTLYNYFRSKEELFVAVMNDACEDILAFMDGIPAAASAGHSVREDLIELGVGFLARLTRDDQVLAMHRLVVAETGRFPELGRLFYDNGPARGAQRFAEYFQRVIAAGRLPPNDPREVGQRLKDLVLSDIYMRRLWGVLDLGPVELRAHVTESVEVFLAAFAPDAV